MTMTAESISDLNCILKYPDLQDDKKYIFELTSPPNHTFFVKFHNNGSRTIGAKPDLLEQAIAALNKFFAERGAK